MDSIRYTYKFYGKRWDTDGTHQIWSINTCNGPMSPKQLKDHIFRVLADKCYLQVTSVDVEVTHVHNVRLEPMYNDGKNPMLSIPGGKDLYYLGATYIDTHQEMASGELWWRKDDLNYIVVWENGEEEHWKSEDLLRIYGVEPQWVLAAIKRMEGGNIKKIR